MIGIIQDKEKSFSFIAVPLQKLNILESNNKIIIGEKIY